MGDGTQREWFYRVDSTLWRGVKAGIVTPFYEIMDSAAPYVFINKPAYSILLNSDGSRHSGGKHVLIPAEVAELIEAWCEAPGYGGYETIKEMLNSIYA